MGEGSTDLPESVFSVCIGKLEKLIMNKYVSISQVQATSIARIPTRVDELDWLYGVSTISDGTVSLSYWGMPVGKISSWAGEGGVGKSRLAIEVARLNVAYGSTVLYFQNEVDLPTFASWVRGSQNLPNFFCSEVTALAEQLSIVRQVAPQLVFVDSINLIEEFGGGRDKEVREIVEGFRDVIKHTGSHIVFLCQLNKDGSAKGSSSLGHMPDTAFSLTNVPQGFKVGVTKKHRYGRTGPDYYGIWRHTEAGVECLTRNREKDSRWCQSHGIRIAPNPVTIAPNFVDFGERKVVSPSPAVLAAVKKINGSGPRKRFFGLF